MELPDVSCLSTGAVSLLALAAGAYDDKYKQRRHDIVEAAVLRRCFDLSRDLPAYCQEYRDHRPTRLRACMATDPLPANLFSMFVGINLEIRRSIVQVEKRNWEHRKRLTGFDHSSFIALATAFSEEVGMFNGVGPNFPDSVAAIAVLNPRKRQERFVVHYLGNVLQDYFDAAAIRRQRPGLPEDTESRLRTEDARAAGQVIFGRLGPSPAGVLWRDFHEVFREFFGAVMLLEKDQHDSRRG